MKIQHVLIFCFLSALCRRNFGLVRAQIPIYTGAEGGDGTINCYLAQTGGMKFFCRAECQEGNIIIKTDNVTANNGRYSIVYRNGPAGQGILSVTFTYLTQSDAGQYRCGLGTSLSPYSYSDFGIRVSNAPLHIISGFIVTYTVGKSAPIPCNNTVSGSSFLFCKNQCINKEDILIDAVNVTTPTGRYSIYDIPGNLHVLITQVTTSDTGWYRCGYGSPSSLVSLFAYPIIVIDAPTSSTVPQPGYIFPLVVCISLVAVLLFAAFLCKRKKMRNSDKNTSRPEDGRNTQVSVVYENCVSDQTCEDSLYQSINPATREQDYCTVTRT